MANLKIVKEKEMRENEKFIRTRVLNLDTNEYIVDEEYYDCGLNRITALNSEKYADEGVKIVDVNGQSKAIVVWKKPIYEINGKLVGFCGEDVEIDEILKRVKYVYVYNTDGKLVFETTRMYEYEENIKDFKIKFKENAIYLTEMETPFGEPEHIITQKIYNYDGNVLFNKKETITNQDILDKVETYELSK